MPGNSFRGENAIDYAKFYSRSPDAVIRVYDESGNVIETHEHKGELKAFGLLTPGSVALSDEFDAYGTVILRISPNPAGGGPKPTLET